MEAVLIRGSRILTIAVWLTGMSACSLPARANSTPTAAAPGRVEAPTSSPTQAFASIPFGQAALVAERDGITDSMAVIPVDPATGLPLQRYSPIDLGESFRYMLSKSGDVLIFTRYASSDSSRGELHFLNLKTWKDEFAILLLSADRTSAIALSPDGSQLAVATVEPQGGGLWLVDARLHRVEAHVSGNTVISSLEFTRDSQNLMSYEHPAADKGAKDVPPTVALRAASDLAVEWSKSLPQVEDGYHPNASSGGDPNQPGSGSIYQPAILFAPMANLMYIVHADVDKLTRVDFDRKVVLTLEIRRPSALLQERFGLSAIDAHASAQSGIQAQARISPDGTVAYADGMQTTVTRQADGSWLQNQSPLKLRAIHLKDAVEVYQSSVEGSTLELSADGTQLLVQQMDQQTGVINWTTVVEAADGSVTQQFPGLALGFGQRLDGTPIIVSATRSLADSTKSQLAALTVGYRPIGSWTAPGLAEWLVWSQ